MDPSKYIYQIISTKPERRQVRSLITNLSSGY